MTISSVLVANRGEIALRIMRTARDLGLHCVAVYTDADADAPHVAFADRAVRIGTGPAQDSYLSADAILHAAGQSGADAIHPGYGFLSENADFARAVQQAGLIFIGPSPEVIALMGNKAAAKREMIAAGVPCVPGYEGADQSDAVLAREAARIGYPVMIKAAAGGGGRGMRLVDDAGGFADALALARSEAASAFGSDEMILEKAVTDARHVEVQVFADRHGAVVHLFERDCSVQRRHQKIIEEAPCPVLSQPLRDAMGAAAVRAAAGIGYVGAGTVEFLLDGDSFYFLEMNTRLQVEHPVTELVTGRDLVALQIAVARGAPLGFAQGDVTMTGRAIEARLYAEDPGAGFLPATGRVGRWSPATGPGVRVDAGVCQGQGVSPFYDPMLAKVIAHGADRAEALSRLRAALQDTVVFGLETNRDFLLDVLGQPAFAAGSATTDFVGQTYGDAGWDRGDPGFGDIALAAALVWQAAQRRYHAQGPGFAREQLGWSSAGQLQSRLKLGRKDRSWPLTITTDRTGALIVSDGTRQAHVTCGPVMRVDGHRVDLRDALVTASSVFVAQGAGLLGFDIIRAADAPASQGGGDRITAPMHGVIKAIDVATGDRVTPGTALIVLEAMKMQHRLVADIAGNVAAILCAVGDQVPAGAVLIELEPQEATDATG